jgi:hypothetical protein
MLLFFDDIFFASFWLDNVLLLFVVVDLARWFEFEIGAMHLFAVAVWRSDGARCHYFEIACCISFT